MPLTAFQHEVLQALAAHRNPDSFVGGGAVINRAETSPRYSEDLDLFHDVMDSVTRCADADAARLTAEGYEVEWRLRQTALHRANVRRGSEEVRLDWCFDSAFRFFPVLADAQFGWRLHDADVATNKVLALASRAEIRDYLDILHLHASYLSLGALCWAACGKDLGFSPWSLLGFAKRHVGYRDEHLAKLRPVQLVRLTDLKVAWVRAAEEAEALFPRLPAEEVGCLYLGPDSNSVTPDPGSPDFARLTRHFGSVRGAWPTVS